MSVRSLNGTIVDQDSKLISLIVSTIIYESNLL